MVPSTRENSGDESADLRQEMVDRLKHLGLVKSVLVEEALRAVPRHIFVPQADLRVAYQDQVVVTRWQGNEAISSASAPSIVALMLEMLDLQPGQRVLEIGAGTGYNAALLARLVGESGQVVTIDLDEKTVQEAQAHLRAAGSENVRVICGDGALGWAEHAPYDRVILTAAISDIVPVWYRQLVRGGRLVAPLRLLNFRSRLMEPPQVPDQFLVAFTWTGEHFESLSFLPCIFMPLRGAFSMPVREIPIHEDVNELSALLPDGIEERASLALLQGRAEDEVTELHLARQELLGLRLWLALRDPRFCEIYVPEGARMDAIPAYLRRDRTFATAIGLCDSNSCCLIHVEEETEGYPADVGRPLRLVLRCFGERGALLERLRAQVLAWERAGYPFIWSKDGFGTTMRDTRLRAFPREARSLPVAQEHETLLVRRHTAFLFTTQATGLERAAHIEEPVESERKAVRVNEHLESLKLGKERWNRWRQENPEIQPRLIGCDLRGLILKEMDLRGVHLNGSNLAQADLFGSDLSGADLRGANLSRVHAAYVNLGGADLSGADLRGSFLVKASLKGARLWGANLAEALLKNTSLERADLAGAHLNFAHLKRVALEGANLSGTSLMGLDLQETYLPDLDARGNLWFNYRQRARHLLAPLFPEVKSPFVRDFAVRQHPLLVISETAGAIHIQGWDRPGIRITGTHELPTMRQEQDTVFLQGGDHNLFIFVPHLPHALLKLIQHGSDSITTAITLTDARGNITIAESGRVEMRGVSGHILLDAIAGDVVLNNAGLWATLRNIMGNIQIRNTARALVEICAGSLSAEHITEALHCGSIAGTCQLSACQQAEVSIGEVGGNARLEGKVSALDCRVSGNVELHCVVQPAALSRIAAGGNISLYLPAEPDLALSITSGDSISGDARILPTPPDSSFAHLVYGHGQARLDITAGGNVRVLSEETPI